MRLDLIDRKILYQLDTDARQSDTQIARKLRVSRDTVSYRIRRLQEEGVITSFITILNHHALGYLGFRVFLRFSGLSQDLERRVVAFLADKAAWVVRARGNWTFNTMLFARDVHALEAFIRELKSTFEDSLIDTHLSIITRIYHYRRGFLLPQDKDASPFEVMGAAHERIALDAIDTQILAALQEDARKTSVDVARAIDATERVVRYRIKQLIAGKVILGFRARLDLQALQMSYYKIHLRLADHGPTTLQALHEHAHLHPAIVYRTETIGGWDLELEAQVSSSAELYALIDEMIETFPGAIQDHEVLEYDKEYQLSYLNCV